MRIVLVLLLVVNTLSAQNANPQHTPASLVAEAARVRDSNPSRALELLQEALGRIPPTVRSRLSMQAELMRCRLAMEESSDSLLVWSDRALTAARDEPAAIGHAFACRGYALDNLTGEQHSALAYYDSAIARGEEYRNDTILADAHVGRGELHYSRGDFATSVSDLTRAYRLFTSLRIPSREAYALTALANLYADQRVGQYDRALEYYRQVLAVHMKSQNQAEIAATYFNIGGTLERKQQLEEALQYYRRALAIDSVRNDPDEVAYDKRAIAVVLYHLNRPGEAIVMADQALAQFLKSGNEALISMARLTRGIALRMLGRYQEALAELTAAHAYYLRNDNNRFLEWTNQHLALTYAALGEWQKAYDARVAQLEVEKRLNAQALDERTARMRVQFDAEKKEAENRALLRENAQIARVHQLQYAVLALSGLVIVILVLFALRQIKGSRRLRITALTDELTGLPNRRHLALVAEEHFAQARAKQAPLGVLVIDVDHFKQINDTFGHAAGDGALRHVAQILQSTLRDADVVGRVGGDEFIVILPGAAQGTADHVASRIHSAVASTDFQDIHPELVVTVSIGAAVMSETDSTVGDTVKRADAMLYAAKSSGRNRVAVVR